MLIDESRAHSYCKGIIASSFKETLTPFNHLSHQKEAIDFICRRETGELSSELSLWKYNDLDMDEPL